MMSADESILLSRHARFFVRHISGVDPGDHYRPAFNFQEPRFEEYPKRLTRIFREESARAPETAARRQPPNAFGVGPSGIRPCLNQLRSCRLRRRPSGPWMAINRPPMPGSCLLAPASCLLPPASCPLPPASCLLPPASLPPCLLAPDS